jgi:hypothetical protein
MLADSPGSSQTFIQIESIDETAQDLAAKCFGGLCAGGFITYQQLTAEDDGVARMVTTLATVLKMAFKPIQVEI